MGLTDEQKRILDSKKKNLIVSASAGSGKTFVVIEYLINLLKEKKIPLSRLLVLTFTKAAAGEMKNRLNKAILEQPPTPFLIEQIDEIPLADISTIDAFCEKLLKKYSNKTGLGDNFVVLDEKKSVNLKIKAFNESFETFAGQNDDDFDFLYLAFKKNKDNIFETIKSIGSFLDSQKEGDDLLEQMLSQAQENSQKANDYLNQLMKNMIEELSLALSKIDISSMAKQYQDYYQCLLDTSEIKVKDRFVETCQTMLKIDLPSFPRAQTTMIEEKEKLTRAKEKFFEITALAKKYEYYSPSFEESEKKNRLLIGIVKLYKLYKENYNNLKSYYDGIDFADMELFALKLLNDDAVEQDLQEKYDYIFIDEYQDTNSLQESIVKPIAQKGRFIAVGDIKQGIYGFRNASMEIMQNDINQFSSSPDGDALYLTGNFRSNGKILDFVNSVFEKLMRQDNVGIDYTATSMLKGMTEFAEDGFKPVEVDIALSGEEKEEAKTGVYSVREDELSFDQKYEKEVKVIAGHIEKFLAGMIYDAKNKVMRPVSQGDIAILFRNRNALMKETLRFLQEKGFNVIADIKQTVKENGQIASIISYLKTSICKNDEISLVGAMTSWLGGFTLDEMIKFSATKEKSLLENVLSSKEEKVKNFLKELDDFSFDCQIQGLTKALNNLFNAKNYYLYLKTLPNYLSIDASIREIFKIIGSGDFDFNRQGFIDYMDAVETQTSGSGGDSNAITMTTIHATKGLEYPIVILAGGGEALTKPDTSQCSMSRHFGLGTDLFDFDENISVPSLAKLAGRLSKKKKEYIDEIMIFYVALTRAQNHLIVTGTMSEKNIGKIHEGKNYLSMILSSFGENFAQTLFEKGKIENEELVFNVIDEVEEQELIEKKQEDEEIDFDMNEIGEYLNYVYPNVHARLPYKNSVTSILENESDEETFYSDERNEKQKELSLQKEKREEAITRGNAYHQAIKVIDFAKVESVEGIKLNLKNDDLNEGYFELIDFELLFKNIQIIKNVLSGQKAIKEREFITKSSLKEMGIAEQDDEVIIQGVVDLFSLGKKNILIDYKFTSINSDEKLIKKYGKQIELYSLALEKSFEIKIDEKYLLSLKTGRLIKL